MNQLLFHSLDLGNGSTFISFPGSGINTGFCGVVGINLHVEEMWECVRAPFRRAGSRFSVIFPRSTCVAEQMMRMTPWSHDE